MKRMCLIAAALAVLVLSGCGQRTEAGSSAGGAANQMAASQTEGDRNPPAEEPGREATTELEFTVEGQTEKVPATLYIGQGYSIYIPDGGWRMKKDADDGIPEEIWESTLNNDVELTISRYGNVSAQEARQHFAEDNDDYVFEDLMGGEFGDPLIGTDEDGDRLHFMTAEGTGSVYVISWEYPAKAAEGFGVRLEQIANTFALM